MILPFKIVSCISKLSKKLFTKFLNKKCYKTYFWILLKNEYIVAVWALNLQRIAQLAYFRMRIVDVHVGKSSKMRVLHRQKQIPKLRLFPYTQNQNGRLVRRLPLINESPQRRVGVQILHKCIQNRIARKHPQRLSVQTVHISTIMNDAPLYDNHNSRDMRNPQLLKQVSVRQVINRTNSVA